MTAYLVVRSHVPEADHEAFDKWYQAEHLPDGKKAFKALSASRGWTDGEDGLHVAMYEFPSLSYAQKIMSSEEIREMIAEFDRVWQGRVHRTRELLEIRQTI